MKCRTPFANLGFLATLKAVLNSKFQKMKSLRRQESRERFVKRESRKGVPMHLIVKKMTRKFDWEKD